MQYDIVLTKKPENGYTARPVTWPEVVVSGHDEAEVLALVSDAIAELQANSRIVRIEVPAPPAMSSDPWLRFTGMWAHDPDWEQFQTEIKLYRHAIDQHSKATQTDNH